MDSAALREARIAVETLMLESMLKPLVASSDTFASFGMESFAQQLAQRLEAS